MDSSISLDEFGKRYSRLIVNPDTMVLDVRSEKEWRHARIQGTRHIPLDQLPAQYHMLPDGLTIYTHCAHGRRAKEAAEFLRRQGFETVFIDGDIENWRACGLPVVEG